MAGPRFKDIEMAVSDGSKIVERHQVSLEVFKKFRNPLSITEHVFGSDNVKGYHYDGSTPSKVVGTEITRIKGLDKQKLAEKGIQAGLQLYLVVLENGKAEAGLPSFIDDKTGKAKLIDLNKFDLGQIEVLLKKLPPGAKVGLIWQMDANRTNDVDMDASRVDPLSASDNRVRRPDATPFSPPKAVGDGAFSDQEAEQPDDQVHIERSEEKVVSVLETLIFKGTAEDPVDLRAITSQLVQGSTSFDGSPVSLADLQYVLFIAPNGKPPAFDGGNMTIPSTVSVSLLEIVSRQQMERALLDYNQDPLPQVFAQTASQPLNSGGSENLNMTQFPSNMATHIHSSRNLGKNQDSQTHQLPISKLKYHQPVKLARQQNGFRSVLPKTEGIPKPLYPSIVNGILGDNEITRKKTPPDPKQKIAVKPISTKKDERKKQKKLSLPMKKPGMTKKQMIDKKPKKHNLVNAKKPRKRQWIDEVTREKKPRKAETRQEPKNQVPKVNLAERTRNVKDNVQTRNAPKSRIRKIPKDASPKAHHASKPRELPKGIKKNPKPRARKTSPLIAPKPAKREREITHFRAQRSKRKEIPAPKLMESRRTRRQMPSYLLNRMLGLYQWKSRGKKLISRKKSVR